MKALAECGTSAAYRRHLRHGEKACGPCLAAKRAEWRPQYVANRRARRRAARSVRASGSTSDVAQVLPGAANDSGDLGLVLSGVHGLDDERVHGTVPASLVGDGTDEPGHDGRLLIGQREHTSSASNLGMYQRLGDLTLAPVTAKILCTYDGVPPRLLQQTRDAATPPTHQEESAA